MNRRQWMLAMFLAWLWAGTVSGAEDALLDGWRNPPVEARLRAYWWWLNANVDKAAITKDLEWMKSIGMGGGLIFDAGGPAGPTPVGPLYGSPEWRDLFRHALKEADRLGLELTLSAQSGWNLGGPCVKPEQSSKHITWSEMTVTGPTNLSVRLPVPKQRSGFYADSFLLAYRLKDGAAAATPKPTVKASSLQPGCKAESVLDGTADTFWVSHGKEPGQGPTRENPEWLQFDFEREVTLGGVRVTGRAGYGPRDCEWQESGDGKQFKTVHAFSLSVGESGAVMFAPVSGRHFRLLITSSYDPKVPKSPRNVQVSGVSLLDREGHPLSSRPIHPPIRQLEAKCVLNELGGSAPDCSGLLSDIPGTPGEEDLRAADVVNLSAKMDGQGNLKWDCPAGRWQLLRFGYTVSGGHVSTSSGDWKGFVVDYLDADVLKAYWRQVVEPLLEDAGPLAGRVLKGFQTDSWEGGGISWTLRMADEFRNRRGYDLTPYLPVFAGRIVESREVSNRFLNDFRRTVADCMAENHYGTMSALAAQKGMYIHCEASGPHAGPFDGLKNLGRCVAPMGEFWVQSPHRPTEESRFFTKVASSAAHTYGRKIACAEGFTSIGPHWNDVLWSSQKPTFDHEACAGMNLTYWHAFTCSPASMGIPGQEYFAGTHFDPQITWSKQAHAFVGYLDRCHYLLQQGLAVADVGVYSGDHVPNIPGRKQQDPAGILPGYDYDVFNEEVLLTRMSVKDGRVTLPDGMSYRVLKLPDLEVISLPALKKIRALVLDGAVVVGPKPMKSSSLTGYPACDIEVKRLADELWGEDGKGAPQMVDRKVGKGRVVSGRSVKEMLAAEQLLPDFECQLVDSTVPVFDRASRKSNVDYIHRSTADAEIYFISNQRPEPVRARVLLRATGCPELWEPVTGRIRALPESSVTADGRTELPLEFDVYGSLFVLFRKGGGAEIVKAEGRKNFPALSVAQELAGGWDVSFDPKWGGPAEPVRFESLSDWTSNSVEGIRYYSGTATYRKTFDLAATGARLWLDLGSFGDIAEVRLNGRNLGVIWAKPFRVDITGAVEAKGNRLEIDIVNSWFNRVLFDQSLPVEKRLTRTNVKLKPGAVPAPSGLFGPVWLMTEE